MQLRECARVVEAWGAVVTSVVRAGGRAKSAKLSHVREVAEVGGVAGKAGS